LSIWLQSNTSISKSPTYIVPGKKADKGFVLLREVLKRTGKVVIGKVMIHNRQYLSALIPQGNVLRFYQELCDPAEFKPTFRIPL
jgi:DNA end-binding protein Ku